MTHTYQITGMTCGGCQHKVQTLLSQVKNVQKVDISLAEGTADITMAQHIPTTTLQDALKDYPKYQLSEAQHSHEMSMEADAEKRTWLATYKPILLIFAYVLTIAIIAGYSTQGFMAMTAMRIFMSGFFLVFSFFKLLNLQGFADSYSMYDIVAKRFKSWGYIYAFIELGLGLAFALNIAPFAVNLITFIVMTISLIGVLQSVLNKRKIQCACLGAVFNLPMSTVTIVEDALMILMSAVTLLSIF
ncbi:heavy-metal-associated domain-containing protein [Mucilaginibacter sp. SP1R1]|uniref:heavy-metal-associated domain-containing protein n=1 Tax=Mucilaginibacter sp. SP1R1 TaxID=2723091 RepID=UPI0016210424|nr:heavy metal-associated domain-containing protein [Mucilaginibacter sp. SP1R1]MBB6152309.1 copper chaperone CopZ [Mucilaginibacter sp. SP1R1]